MTIRVAIVGIGNCASAFVQGLSYYRSVTNESSAAAGLMHNDFGGYLPRDIEIVAAFDVNANKVGKDVADAIWVKPNNARKFAETNETGVIVSPGFLGDGIAAHVDAKIPRIARCSLSEMTRALRKSGAEMLINFLPVGSKRSTRALAQACIESKTAFINGIPEFIASDPEWARKFRDAQVPVAGDDVMSQFGATIVHIELARLMRERGCVIDNSYQTNVGGNMDFLNMIERSRVISKEISKTRRVAEAAECAHVKAMPAGYIPHLCDTKVANINFTGRNFGGNPFKLRLELEVQDSPNDAGTMIDAVRAMKVSLDMKLSGTLAWASYYFKHPMRFVSIENARKSVDELLLCRAAA